METNRNCRRIRKKLAAYQDGELCTEERDHVSTHLQSCLSCRNIYVEMEDVWQSLDMVNEIQPTPGFYRRLYRRIHTPANQHHRWRFPWFLQLFTTPVATFALLLVGLLLGAFLGNSIVTVGPWSVKHPADYSQTQIAVDYFKVFAPAPPGSLGDGYLRVASVTEERTK